MLKILAAAGAGVFGLLTAVTLTQQISPQAGQARSRSAKSAN
jgi:hypothetical protein